MTVLGNMKLHLGCGQRYLQGYTNIDFPLEQHTVQQKSIADELCDLRELHYPAETIAEVRCHHVFEHFPKAEAAALLAAWNSWLKDGGIVHIEVPDFRKSAIAAISHFRSRQKRYVALRHIFGSQEASWAIHYEGYTANHLVQFLATFGFMKKKVLRNSYRGTFNIEIIAVKSRGISVDEAERAASGYFEDFLVAPVPGEFALKEYWLKQFRIQLEKSWAR
jgi:predicted SAM-dependent methyltransferase